MKQVTLIIDGKKYESNAPVKLSQILSLEKDYDKNTIALASVNGRLTSLMEPIGGNAEVETIPLISPFGKRAYRKTLCFLLSYASALLHPELSLIIGHSLGDGFYFRYRNGEKPDTDKLIGQQEGYANVSYPVIPQTLIGYGCTEALRHYNETADEDKKCIAVSAVDTYAATNIAPDGTSGWYLPSLKELALLISGDFELQNQVNKGTTLAAERDKQLEAAKGDKLIGAYYWASAEKAGSSGSQAAQWVWCYHCEATKSGRPISVLKNLSQSGSSSDYSKDPLRTRAILAF